MRIGFDKTFAEINQAGTGVYVRSLYEELHTVLGDGLIPFSVGQKRDLSKPKTLRVRLDTLYRDLFWMHFLLPIQVKNAKVNLLHMPANLSPLVAPCPVVLSILDTILYQNPRNFPFWQRNYFRAFGPRSARHARHIITISEASKQDIISTFGVPPEKVTAIPIAVSPAFQVAEAETVRALRTRLGVERFILTVGAIEPRKNLDRLIAAFAQVRKVDPGLHLIHAGPLGWHMDHLNAKIEQMGLSSCIHFLGRVSRNDLVLLYNAALMLVYPSLYEGFGLPVLEAMSCGCPVITSNISSLPEVAQDAGILVDPLKTEAIFEGIQRLLAQPDLARELRHSGLALAAQFSWGRTAAETISVYKSVFSS